MTKRTRKKWLKKHGLYIDPKETLSLDMTIAEFVLPRLKLYKKLNNGVPARLETIDEWNEILDKIIRTFEYLSDESCNYCVDTDMPNWIEEYNTRQIEVKEGLDLFAKYFQALWR